MLIGTKEMMDQGRTPSEKIIKQILKILFRLRDYLDKISHLELV